MLMLILALDLLCGKLGQQGPRVTPSRCKGDPSTWSEHTTARVDRRYAVKHVPHRLPTLCPWVWVMSLTLTLTLTLAMFALTCPISDWHFFWFDGDSKWVA